MADFILTLDQGTTSSRALVIDKKGQVQALAQKEFKQHYPKESWVEHDAEEIWQTQLSCAQDAIKKLNSDDKLVAIGITNQRETTVVWNRKTGKPIHNAIVWQDRRTAEFCDQLRNDNKASLIQEKTGLIVDSYFSGSKLKWVLDHVPEARDGSKGRVSIRNHRLLASLESDRW